MDLAETEEEFDMNSDMVLSGVRILGTGRALPSKCISNEDLSRIVDTDDAWIRSRTGIISRYQCDPDKGESCGSLAVEAARKAIEASGLPPEEIGAVITASSTADYALPSCACLIQKECGLSEDVMAFDLQAACTGFLFALGVARGLFAGLHKKKILLVGAEQLSRIVDYKDRSTCILFGDGAGAAVVEPSDGMFWQRSWSRGNIPALNCPGVGQERCRVSMQGNEVFRFAVNAMAQAIDQVLADAGKSMDEVDLVICHQANERIIRHVQKRYKGQEDKFYINIQKYGNTSAASIPLALDEARERGLVKPGMRLLLVGFGGGLTWSGALFEC